MIKTNDFFNAMAVFGAIIYFLRKKDSQNNSGFNLKFYEVNDYDKILIENISSDSMDISIQNEENTKGVIIKYGQEEKIIVPGGKINMTLLPNQVLSGRTFYGKATISILIQ